MKKKLCRLIFKKELDEAYTVLENNYRQEMLKLEIFMNRSKKRYELIRLIFSLYPNSEIIGLDKNKSGEELIIVLRDNDTICLFGDRYQGISEVPVLFFEIREKKGYIFKEKHIHIVDVLMKDNNIGNGTVAMSALIKYARKINAKYIDGCLSSFDNDHADRRNHYYQKFGFVIKDSYIYLKLTDNRV